MMITAANTPGMIPTRTRAGFVGVTSARLG